jgi:polysaccharide export outer membrane protein
MKILRYLLALAVTSGGAFAQLQPQPPAQQQAGPTVPQQDLNPQLQQLRPNYVLRPGDQILIRAFEVEEISERPFRVDGDGFVNLPVLGRLKAGGLTVENLEASLIQLLKKYVVQPQVTVTVVQFSSEPVFFVGAFKAPGIYPLAGRRTLVEMMSSIGGLQSTASRRIKIVRRKEYGAIPLRSAVPAPDGNGTSVEINMASLRDNLNPAEDIVLEPFDVVSVERAEMVYVIGEVGKVGAFELQERDSISVIQALTLAGGLAPSANGKTAWILRPVMNTSRRAQITLDVQRILAGQDRDKPLLPNDVLFVPKSGLLSAKNVGRAAIIALPAALAVTSIALTLTR